MSHQWHYDYPKIARDSGFNFKEVPKGSLDWRLIGSIEIEKLIREKSFERIDSIVEHLTEAPLASMLDTNILDSGIAKYFSLSQMTIQYLVFCKKFLDETVISLRETLIQFQTENLKLTQTNKENSSELLQLHKKLQRLEEINEVIYPCSMCTKNFVSNEMLNTHIKRKHSNNQNGELTDKNSDRNLINTIKLELEIKHLKERLNVAEKEIRDKSLFTQNNQEEVEKSVINDKQMKNLCSIATQIDFPITKNVGIQSNLMETKEKDDCSLELGTEKNSNILIEIQDKICKFENWKQIEQETNHKSISEIQQKLEEIVVTLDEKNRNNAEVLKSVVDNAISKTVNVPQVPTSVIPSFGEEIQKQISETLEKISSKNEENLNAVVHKIETSYEEKLKTLEEEIRRQNEKLSKDFLTASRENLLERQEAAKELRTFQQQIPEKQTTTIFPTQQKDQLENNIGLKKDRNSVAIESSPEKKLTHIGYDTTTIDSESSSNSEDSDLSKTGPKISTCNAQFPEKSRILISNRTLPKKKAFKKNRKNILPAYEFRRIDAIKLADKRLNKIGFEPKAIGISKLSAEKAAIELAQSREFNKKLYPNFYVTRNKLKKFVDRICFEKKLLKEKPIKILRVRKEGHVLTNRKEFSSQESTEEPVTKPNQPEKPVPVIRSNQPEKSSIDDFKLRLEKILESPIRKPNPFTITKSDRTEPKQIDSKIAQDESLLKKPVPIPRKRVMFDFPSKNLSQGEHKDPREMYQESEDTSSNVSSLN